MARSPDLASPPIPDWCTVVLCKEEGRSIESQFEDLSKRCSAGSDVTTDVFNQLMHDYGSLLTAYRNTLKERAILDDDLNRLKRQCDTFVGSHKRPFLQFVDVCFLGFPATLRLLSLRILIRFQ